MISHKMKKLGTSEWECTCGYFLGNDYAEAKKSMIYHDSIVNQDPVIREEVKQNMINRQSAQVSEEWREAARTALQHLVETGQQFTSEDVYDAVSHIPDELKPKGRQKTAMGGIMQWGRKNLPMQEIGFIPSRRIGSGGSPKRVYVGTNNG